MPRRPFTKHLLALLAFGTGFGCETATDLPEVAEHFQGGPFCTWGHDGVLRQR